MEDILDADKLLIITKLLVNERIDLMATSVIDNAIVIALGVKV